MKHTLSNGIIIHDNRHLSCGVYIENQPYQNVKLHYSNGFGLYLQVVSVFLFTENTDEHISQLVIMREILQEANAILANKKDGR